ncbi:hypothetical protein ACFVWX_13510 [Streptomyces sp. NPDC058220]|uniref:hypothetical protein n=1 Tax=Streptomyces sp. NPDC058220 TaxID=3346387 RepID=UPI0036E8DE57
MTVARILGAAVPALLLTAAAILAALLHQEARRARRRRARVAEQRARPAPAWPPDLAPLLALIDELALHRDATRHACCPGWWEPSHTYSHHPDCTKEQHHA